MQTRLTFGSFLAFVPPSERTSAFRKECKKRLAKTHRVNGTNLVREGLDELAAIPVVMIGEDDDAHVVAQDAYYMSGDWDDYCYDREEREYEEDRQADEEYYFHSQDESSHVVAFDTYMVRQYPTPAWLGSVPYP